MAPHEIRDAVHEGGNIRPEPGVRRTMKRIGGLLVALALASCGPAETREGPLTAQPAEGGTWTKLPASPLAPRWGAHAVEVDGKLLVLGGTGAPACPPTADCITPKEPPYSDGAAYDPATETWTRLAPSPVPIGYASSAVMDETVYFLVAPFRSSHPTARDAFLSYDAARNEWSELELPPSPDHRILAATDSLVVAYQGSQESAVLGDFGFDPASRRWSRMPADPLRASYDRSMVWTDHGLVLLALEHVPNPGAEEPSLYRAALLEDDEWRRLPDSEVVGWNPMWSWTRNRVLNASTERADGGETNNWGSTYFAGGMFDPATGEWASLPNVPDGHGPFTGIYASNHRYGSAGGGWIFDAEERSWLELTRPPGAPDGDHAHAWVGDELVVWGGVRWEGSEGVLLGEGWSWVRENP